jgi:protein-tyrosine phosphatase
MRFDPPGSIWGTIEDGSTHMTKWIELEGAHNVRDLGGLPAAQGRTRPRVLLRSDAVDSLTAADVTHLVEHVGLRHVVDLRSEPERVERGRGLLGARGTRYTELQVLTPQDLRRRATTRAALFAAGHPPAHILSDGYVELLELGAPAFAQALVALVEPTGTPALVHCAIGKDRTGVLVALLLAAAEVDRAAIVADYAASTEGLGRLISRRMDSDDQQVITDQVAAFTATAPAETMDRMLDTLEARWGGAAAFFRAHGIDSDVLDAWKGLLIEPR